jgi:puromycin-sensitive aminopeptidase
MEWWTHLWLNEGFASWIEYLCVDHCFPEWQIWTQFVYQDLARGLGLDALESSHPIEVPVGHPAEVDEVFDVISYSKGCSVIRMLHGFLGEEVFRTALKAYLNEHKYKNTFTEDLWAALEKASGEPVAELMDTWTKKMGFPFLTVSSLGAGKYQLTQKRFLASSAEAGDETWIIPLTFISSTGAQMRLTMKDREMQVDLSSISGSGDDAWIKVNVNQTGYMDLPFNSPRVL